MFKRIFFQENDISKYQKKKENFELFLHMLFNFDMMKLLDSEMIWIFLKHLVY